MSSIRVSGNTSGHYDLTVPDVAGSNTIALDKIVVTDSNGNVGIGTTSPVYKLHVNSGATNVVADFESTDGIAGIRLRDNSGNVELSASGNDFRVQPAGSTAEFVVKNGGNVGIGTPNPGDKLTISGGHLSITSTAYGIKLPGAITSDGQINYRNAGSSVVLNSYPLSNQTIRLKGSTDLLNFESDKTGVGSVLNMNTSGHVGIGGIPTSVYGLEIQKSNAGAALYLHNKDVPGVTGAGVYHAYQITQTNGQSARVAEITALGASNWGGELLFATKPANGAPNNSATERMRIDSSGNVGIGIDNPQKKLEVRTGNGELSHFGSNSANAVDNYTGISLGYAENGNSAYRKVGIVSVGRGDGAARQDLAFLVDSNADGGSAQLADTKMRISHEGYVTTPNQPSFRAGRSGNYVAGVGNNILFNLTSGTQLFNIGGHYSTSTGLFTAPASGSYIFHAVVIWGPGMPNGEDMADSFRLVYNGARFHYSERRSEYVDGTTGNGGYYVDHATCIAQMNANDTMGVYSQEAVSVHGNEQYTTFAGHKIG